jgi:hypothetical protein
MTLTRARLESLPKILTGPIDLFICSASYEDRCLGVARAIVSSDLGGALVAENMNHADSHRGHGDALRTLVGKAVSNTDLCLSASLTTDKPLETADELWNKLQTFSGARRIVIDITTFTHEALLILCRILSLGWPNANLTFVYTGAAEYSVGDSQDSKWLSRGIRRVRSVLGYPGELVPSRKTHLILLAGIEHDRATELVRWYEPSVISLGFGQPDPTSDAGKENVHRAGFDIYHKRFSLLRAFFAEANDFCFDPFSVSSTFEAISIQAAKHSHANVVIAPMNTKLSTLGAAIFALSNMRVQLCYAQALLYNSRGYSRTSEFCYVTQMQEGLGSISEFPAGSREAMLP